MDQEKWATDDDSQPFITAWSAARREGRNLDELIGLIRGIVADGKIVKSECDFLATWLNDRGEDANVWPVRIIVDRLSRIYEDGIVTDDELDDLRALLIEVVGGTGKISAPATLPFTKPVPEIIFDGNIFVFTGRFASGTLSRCQTETTLLGAQCEERVTLRTDYLVVGSLGTDHWRHSTWGDKIEQAVRFQRTKADLYIVSEERWLGACKECG